SDLRQRRLDSRCIERQVADTFAGCIGKSIDDRGGRRPLRGFARTKGTLARTVDQLDLDGGRFRHGEDWIACPVAREDPAAVVATSSFKVQLTDWTIPPSI